MSIVLPTTGYDRCFACGRPLKLATLVDTRDGQTVYVGTECARKVIAAGEAGWQPTHKHGRGGPRLWPIWPNDATPTNTQEHTP